jgi:hypothetical protein
VTDAPAVGTVASAPLDLYALDREGLVELMERLGEPRFRAAQVASWLVRGVDDPLRMTDLPGALRDRLAGMAAGSVPQLVAHHVADDGRTHKFLLRFADGEAIETVLMRYPRRATVCISTQAGCAMGCPFCATGQAGLRRQLTAGEIVRQVMVAQQALSTAASATSGSEPQGSLAAGRITSPTWSTWAWVSPWPTSMRRSPASDGCTTRRASASRRGASPCRPSVSSLPSDGSPTSACPSPWR